MLLLNWQKPKDKKNIKKNKKKQKNKQTKTQTLITQYQSKAPHEASL